MPKWEVCKIRGRVERWESKRDFWSVTNRQFIIIEAITDTPQGERVIDQSAVYELDIVDDRAKLEEQERQGNEERAKLVGRLLADGWEPIQSESGEVTTFRRAIPGT